MNDGWPLAFFDAPFAEAVLDRPDDCAAERTAAFLVDVLQLAPGARVFDQGCGTGRIALPLARRGLAVIGVDLSSDYVARARARADAERLRATFHAGDASSWEAPHACDGAFNWGTSFGFHPDRHRNEAMVAAASSSLRPGGRFALDVANADQLRRTLRPTWTQHVQTAAGEVEIVRRSRIDPATDRLVQEWTFHGAIQTSPRAAQTFLWSRESLVAMFERSGLRVVALFGSESGESLSSTSERCIVVGERVA